MAQSLYWISTALISFFLLMSTYTYFFSEPTQKGLNELGFPDFFRIQLGILKGIALVLLLLPALPIFIKDWAYAGVGLFLITALVAHIAHRDSIGISILLIFLLVILAVSRFTLGSG